MTNTTKGYKSPRTKFVMLGNQRLTTNCSNLKHTQCGGAGGECECGCHD